MGPVSSISLSGMQAAQMRLQASAHNVANLQTENFHRQEVQQEAQANGGTQASVRRASQAGSSLEADVVDQLMAKNSFLANLAVFRIANRTAGALLDTQA